MLTLSPPTTFPSKKRGGENKKEVQITSVLVLYLKQKLLQYSETEKSRCSVGRILSGEKSDDPVKLFVRQV